MVRRGMARAIWIFLVVLFTFVVSPPLSTFASGGGDGCNPQRSNNGIHYLDGWYRDGSTGGVYSEIWNYSPWVSSGAVSTAWVMVNNKNTTHPDWWYAQAGWLEYYGGARHTFYEYTQTYCIGTNCTHSYVHHDYNPAPINTYRYYTVLYDPPTQTFTFRLPGYSDFTATDSDFAPNRGQMNGEITTLATQMPGGYTSNYDHTDFFDANIFLGGWQAFSGTAFGYNSTYFNQSIASSSHLYIWDKACPH